MNKIIRSTCSITWKIPNLVKSIIHITSSSSSTLSVWMSISWFTEAKKVKFNAILLLIRVEQNKTKAKKNQIKMWSSESQIALMRKSMKMSSIKVNEAKRRKIELGNRKTHKSIYRKFIIIYGNLMIIRTTIYMYISIVHIVHIVLRFVIVCAHDEYTKY